MNLHKRILAAAMSVTMFASLYTPFVRAEDNTIVYSYNNDTGETINITRADIDAGHWNINYMSHMPIEQYEDFPVMLNSDVNNDAALSLTATYLKVLGENDTASFKVMEYYTDEVYYNSEYDGETVSCTIDELPMNKALKLVLTETIDGETKSYTYAIRTYYDRATMPENVSLDNSEHDLLGITAGKLRIKDVTLGTTEGEDENGEYFFDDHVVFLAPSELPAYYQGINDDHLYSLQASTGEDIYKGFISKNNTYGCPFIFTPAFSKYSEEDSIMPMDGALPDLDYDVVQADIDKMKTLEYFTDTYMYLEHSDWENQNMPEKDRTSHRRLLEFQVLTNDNQRVRTYGTIPTAGFYCFSENKLNVPSDFKAAHWYKLGDPEYPTSVDKTLHIAEECYLYMLITTTRTMTDNGNVTCSINYTGSADNISNSKQELALSNSTNPIAMNTSVSSSIDYAGDVDVFMLPSTITGKHSVALSNLSTLGELEQAIYYCWADNYLFEMESASADVTTSPNRTRCYDYNLYSSSDYKYFLEIKYRKKGLDYYVGNYTFEIAAPNKPDAYESHGSYTNNNSTGRALDLSSLTSPLTGLTMHLSDKDFYKFTTGAGGADATITMMWGDLQCTDPYTMSLEGETTGFWEPTIVGTDSVINATLEPNTTYYICITRRNTKNYCPGHTYSLAWNITENTAYYANLNGNVTLSATTGEASLSEIRQTIANSITFKENNTVIPTATAINDMTLYYTNGTAQAELTSAALNSLTDGTYTISAKYHGVDATGGTISLTLSSASVGNAIEVSYIAEDAANAEWDWVACGKILADHRRIREGSAASDVSVYDAVMMIYPAIDSSITEDDALDHLERVGVSNAVKAARYFYNNGTSLSSSKFVTKSTVADENYFYTRLSANKLVVMYLKSSNDTAGTYDNGRYVVVCGIDQGNQKYKLYDPVTLTEAWYTYDAVMNGGALGRSDLSYSGLVIENP